MSIAAALLASIALALTPTVTIIWREAFRAGPAKRAALPACVEAHPGFRRLIAEQRALCYARQLQAPELALPVPRTLEIATSRF